MDKNNQMRVKSFEPNLIQIEIINFENWKKENTGQDIKIGSFMKIEDGNGHCILTVVKSFKMIEQNTDTLKQNNYSGDFIINTQPIGQLTEDDLGIHFIKGVRNISIPPNGVSIANEKELAKVFSMLSDSKICFSNHLVNENIEVELDGNKFFSKHIAVVGSTGSGKSCTVAKIIQEAKINKLSKLNNTHIVVFDIHGEYNKAFPEANLLSIENRNLLLPYWLMNSEELEDMFIESQESNSHNQVSQFKYAVIQNKIKYNPDIKVTYDSPVYFSIKEVFNYIKNKNFETQYQKDGKTYFATLNSKNEITQTDLLWGEMNFEQSTGNSTHPTFNAKVSAKGGGFNGEFDRFISRLETKLRDERLAFLLSELKVDGTKFSTIDLNQILQNIIGYATPKNITIIDLSSLPFEVVSIVVSIISRLIFDFSYHKIKLTGTNDTPFMLVYEEAHKYVPKNNESRYKNTRIAVERVAKEGRKYGLSLMVVSQRPSELSTTVFSQCNNFVVMRLTNPEDQSFVRRLLPEAVVSYGDSLSSLEQKEALLVGDAVSTPCIVTIKEANPTPQSDDIKFYKEWQEVWKTVDFGEIMKNINREK